MPLSVNINASIDKVFEILDNSKKNSIWNPATDTVNLKPGSQNECDVTSIFGTFPTRKDTEDNKSVTITITDKTKTVLEELKYVLVKGPPNVTLVYGTVKIKGDKYSRVHQSVGRVLLDNLKRYVDHNLAGKPDSSFVK